VDLWIGILSTDLWRVSVSAKEFHGRVAMSQPIIAVVLLNLLCLYCHLVTANPDAKRLYDDLLRKKKYNKLMRPVRDHNNNLTVTINLKLSQLIDVVITTSRNFLHLLLILFYSMISNSWKQGLF